MKIRAKLTLNQKENEDIPSESNARGREWILDSLAIEVMTVSWNHDKFDGWTGVRQLYILNSNTERD